MNKLEKFTSEESCFYCGGDHQSDKCPKMALTCRQCGRQEKPPFTPFDQCICGGNFEYTELVEDYHKKSHKS